jgi:hypothetical protein
MTPNKIKKLTDKTRNVRKKFAKIVLQQIPPKITIESRFQNLHDTLKATFPPV